MPVDLRTADVIIGAAGPAGGGVTNSQLTAAIAGLAPGNAGYITRAAEAGLSNETALGSLATGILKNTTTAGVGALSIAVGADLPTHNHTGVVVGGEYVIDGGGATITTGVKRPDFVWPFSGLLTDVWLLADQAGAISVSMWKDTYANYPPVVGDLWGTVSIPATNTKAQIAAINLPFTAGDIVRFNVNSVTTIQSLAIILFATRSI